MKTYAIAGAKSITVQSMNDVDSETLTAGLRFIILEEGASYLAVRYGLVDGQVVDKFPGLSDEDVLAACESAGMASHESSLERDRLALKLTPTDFLRFLGAERRMAVRALAKAGDPVAEDMLDMLNRVAYVEASNTDLVAAFTYLSGLPDSAFGKANPFTHVAGDFAASASQFAS